MEQKIDISAHLLCGLPVGGLGVWKGLDSRLEEGVNGVAVEEGGADRRGFLVALAGVAST